MMDTNKAGVFISWSGARSHAVAGKLYEWLPEVIQSVEPWLSSASIEAGARSIDEIASALASTSFGILCLTPGNVKEPWVAFEAGALSKTISPRTHVVPYCIGMAPTDVPRGPLSPFQGHTADKKGTLALLKTLNRAVEAQGLVGCAALERTFERFWGDMDEVLRNLPAEETKAEAPDPVKMIPEILAIVRQLDARRDPSHPTAKTWMGVPPTPFWAEMVFHLTGSGVPIGSVIDDQANGRATVILPDGRSVTIPTRVPPAAAASMLEDALRRAKDDRPSPSTAAS